MSGRSINSNSSSFGHVLLSCVFLILAVCCSQGCSQKEPGNPAAPADHGSADKPAAPLKVTLVQHDPLKGHDNTVTGLRFTPDGKTLISVSWDGTIRQWDPDSNSQKGSVVAGPVNALALSADGKFLATGNTQGDLIVWNLPQLTEAQRHSLLSPDAPETKHIPVELAWAGDGKSLVVLDNVSKASFGSGDFAGSLLRWQPEGDKVTLIKDFNINCAEKTHAVITRDGRLSRDVGKPSYFNIASGKPTAKIEMPRTGVMFRSEFSADGKKLLWVDGGRVNVEGADAKQLPAEITIWNLDSGKKEATLLAPDFAIYGLALSPDGKLLAAAGEKLRIWDVATATEVAAADLPQSALLLEWSPDGHLLAGGDDANNRQGAKAKQIILWDVKY